MPLRKACIIKEIILGLLSTYTAKKEASITIKNLTELYERNFMYFISSGVSHSGVSSSRGVSHSGVS